MVRIRVRIILHHLLNTISKNARDRLHNSTLSNLCKRANVLGAYKRLKIYTRDPW